MMCVVAVIVEKGTIRISAKSKTKSKYLAPVEILCCSFDWKQVKRLSDGHTHHEARRVAVVRPLYVGA